MSWLYRLKYENCSKENSLERNRSSRHVTKEVGELNIIRLLIQDILKIRVYKTGRATRIVGEPPTFLMIPILMHFQFSKSLRSTVKLSKSHDHLVERRMTLDSCRMGIH